MTTTIEKCPCCNTDAVKRFAGSECEYYEAVVENADELRVKLFKVMKAINKYYLALDERKHGGLSENEAFAEIQEAMEMEWERGKILETIKAHPKLRQMYT